jgi:hypothetical protein
MKFFFLEKHLKAAISSSRSPNQFLFLFFAFLTVGSCLRLLGKNVQKVSQKFIARIGKEKFFLFCPIVEEVTHSLQKYKFLVITFEWKVRFG